MRYELHYEEHAERWGMYEVTCLGPSKGNPFTEHWVRGIFTGAGEQVLAEGFYDGNGCYKVRFMPSQEGEYEFEIEADFLEIPLKGNFTVMPAAKGNHGPVRVVQRYHFAYEDGTPYYPFGTTCYVWELQNDERIIETLETLQNSVFNKIRFCIFPKHYDYNLYEPRSYPYVGHPVDSSEITSENFVEYIGTPDGNSWDFARFNPEHFQHIEKCIEALCELGIEADLIVMHPYDRWGFSCMTKEQCDLYWNYVLARFSAYRNVWWSLANEYDLMKNKSAEDWERYAAIICRKDPYHHLRSIHNCYDFYDYKKSWITHCSIQRQDLYKSAELVTEWREKFQKPVVLDEIAYEGNIQHGWGNISGEEMLRRFWEAVCRGGYPGHGETYLNPEGILWWSHGGRLHGESYKRFRFLYEVLQETPGCYLKEGHMSWDEVCGIPEYAEEKMAGYYLFYYSFMRPSFRIYHFDDETEYEVKVIDTWNMTIEERGIYCGRFRVDLPGRPYMAVQIKAI